MKIYEVKSFAKINLALHVTGKLTNLHKIESVVNFIDLHDKIFIKKINTNKHDISFMPRGRSPGTAGTPTSPLAPPQARRSRP